MPTSPDRIVTVQEATDGLGMSVSEGLRLTQNTLGRFMADGSGGGSLKLIFLAAEPPSPQGE